MMTRDLNPAACAAFLVAAFCLAGLCQAVWLGSAWSRRYAWPLDGGRTWRGRRIFGDNKTARGFMVMVPATALSFWLLALLVQRAAPQAGLWAMTPGAYLATGFWAGLGFMAGELPNSFVKRQLGVEPGLSPTGRAAGLASLLADRLDSVLGMLIALSLAVRVPWATWLWVLAAGPGLHGAFSLLVFRLGGKARAA